MFSVYKAWPANWRAFFIIMLALISCKGTASISSEEKEAFIKTYVELSLARMKFGNLSKKYETAKEKIFIRNGTGEEFMNDFLDRISTKQDVQLEVFQAIADRLEQFESLPLDSLRRFWSNLLDEP